MTIDFIWRVLTDWHLLGLKLKTNRDTPQQPWDLISRDVI
jgi:hypothetical protein